MDMLCGRRCSRTLCGSGDLARGCGIGGPSCLPRVIEVRAVGCWFFGSRSQSKVGVVPDGGVPGGFPRAAALLESMSHLLLLDRSGPPVFIDIGSPTPALLTGSVPRAL